MLHGLLCLVLRFACLGKGELWDRDLGAMYSFRASLILAVTAKMSTTGNRFASETQDILNPCVVSPLIDHNGLSQALGSESTATLRSDNSSFR